MKLINLYYQIKGLIPRRTQVFLRRKRASWKSRRVREIWPIDPRSGGIPEGWRGWPDRRKFALALHHDVETARGRDRCRWLIQDEQRLGFRSCFNFVPEDYDLPPGLRHDLLRGGFDVGVHGLKHDGKFFIKERTFKEKAIRVNRYLADWGAVGFTSPAMIRNLEMIADLDIEYSTSSFDTDPFEPQPESAGTIFPYFVRNRAKTRSYVELPYTLPQDHCLFVILQHQDIEIWKRKIDWLAERGGLALVITHPDYMDFEGASDKAEKYPAALYLALLEYIQKTYAGTYWHALPREIARFWRITMPED